MGYRGWIALAAAALALAGCGGSDTSERSDYTTKATAICREAQRNLRAVGNPGAGVGLEAFARRTAAILRREERALRALEPPQEIAADMDRALALMRQLRAKLLVLKRQARSRSLGRIQRALVAAKELDDKGDVVLRRVGLAACAG
jgi:hypothetical protein